MARVRVHATAFHPSHVSRFSVTGQTAKALLALIEAGPRGITALEADAWAYRLAAYCHVLRQRHGLSIRTEREPHPGGWHGRYVLETPVQIDAVTGREEAA